MQGFRCLGGVTVDGDLTTACNGRDVMVSSPPPPWSHTSYVSDGRVSTVAMMTHHRCDTVRDAAGSRLLCSHVGMMPPTVCEILMWWHQDRH